MTTRRCLRPAVLVLLLALAASGYGQWVEDSIDVGGAWVGSMAYNPLMDVVYGRCVYRDGIFFAIDCATNHVVASWPVDWPMYMAYDSIDHKLYLPFGFEAESLAVIDGRTHRRIKAIPLEWARVCVWDGMRDRLYVSCPERGVVAVFDCTQDSLICEIPVGRSPLKMFLNGRHRKLYVLNWDDSSVSVIDLWSNQVVATIPLHSGVAPQSACYCASADKFYCDSYEDVTVIDGATNGVSARIALPAQSMVTALSVNEELGLVFIGVYSPAVRAVYTVDGQTDSVVSVVSVGDLPERILASSESRRTYCVNYSDEVSVLSYDGSQLLTTLPVQDAPFELAYSPRSRRLYVSHLNSRQVYVIRDEAGGIAEE
ncbi:MAG: YncE family protein, partial [bacterium]